MYLKSRKNRIISNGKLIGMRKRCKPKLKLVNNIELGGGSILGLTGAVLVAYSQIKKCKKIKLYSVKALDKEVIASRI